MSNRSLELTEFLESLHQALIAQTTNDSNAGRLVERIMNALGKPGSQATPAPCELPPCGLLSDVFSNLCTQTSSTTETAPLARHGRAMQVLAPSLSWWRRQGADAAVEPFASGHANATVVGPGGLEDRDDVWIGISLMAPGISYPVHHHPPEEVYLVLTRGEWQQDNGSWQEPGVGSIVHNPPGILHAMRSGPVPLLTTWCLLTLAA